LVVDVHEGAVPQVTNTATVVSATSDPAPSSDTDRDPTTVHLPAAGSGTSTSPSTWSTTDPSGASAPSTPRTLAFTGFDFERVGAFALGLLAAGLVLFGLSLLGRRPRRRARGRHRRPRLLLRGRPTQPL